MKGMIMHLTTNGDQCARPDDHNGAHWSIQAKERRNEREREWRTSHPDRVRERNRVNMHKWRAQKRMIRKGMIMEHKSDYAHHPGKISGNNYVPGHLGDEKLYPIVIRTTNRCDHMATICVKCAGQWQWDWTLVFDRTAGGRRLQAALASG